MKNILIFGEGSYIGDAVQTWLQKTERYVVTTMSSIGINVEETDFSSYHVIYYVAGIAHQKETKENAYLYYEVNRNLACAVAKKAKQDGVEQFILMSTLSVYGLNEGVIREDTEEKPTTHYGKSKLQADRIILNLANDKFLVTILRPPMVYGAGCKGNYQRLRSFAMKTPVFPLIRNQRSMIFIGNLCDYVERVIREENLTGIRIPQNKDYVCTSDMVKVIARYHKKKIFFIPLPRILVKIIPSMMLKKVFGNLIVDSRDDLKNMVSNFTETIRLTEEGE